MSEIRIPQYCCATCKHWKSRTTEAQIAQYGAASGSCRVNSLPLPGGNSQPMQTLDLQLCTAWEKSEEAEKVMYGR